MMKNYYIMYQNYEYKPISEVPIKLFLRTQQ